jgi:beta-fructofuranosidase
MVMGAGLADGLGAALQYRSADLRHWSYDGVLCSRLSPPEDQVWTGAVWECPQLFPLGGDWVLLVPVWDADELHYVAGAIGDYDGRKFSPRSWQRLTYGSSAYAMSSFVDKDDKRCVISWSREEPRNNPSLVQRAGAHSVASLLVREEDGLLGLRPHTDVMALAGPASPFRVEGSSELCGHGGPVLVTLSPATADQLALGAPGAVRAEIRVERGRHRVQVVRPGFGDLEMPLSEGANGHDVDVLVDSDLVEVFARGSYGAFRMPPAVTVGLPSSSSLG